MLNLRFLVTTVSFWRLYTSMCGCPRGSWMWFANGFSPPVCASNGPAKDFNSIKPQGISQIAFYQEGLLILFWYSFFNHCIALDELILVLEQSDLKGECIFAITSIQILSKTYVTVPPNFNCQIFVHFVKLFQGHQLIFGIKSNFNCQILSTLSNLFKDIN